jgi:hypothetical protein
MTRWGRFTCSTAALAAAFAACSSDYEVDPAQACRERPGDARCGPAGGTSGASGVAGAPTSGAGGAPMMGRAGASGAGSGPGGNGSNGGNGGNGGSPCDDDATCAASVGAGSLCVATACTKATTTCDAAALVVVDAGRSPAAASALDDACFFRSLDGALAALSAQTTRVVLYADAASSAAPLVLGPGVALEGRASDSTKPVALSLPATDGAVLLTLGAGGSLKGVALDGKGLATAVAVPGGAASIGGPLTIENATLALDLAGDAALTALGTQAAPLRLRGNGRGVQVGPDARLTWHGDGEPASAVIEQTGGVALLVLVGGSSAAVEVEQTTLQGNATGVEIRQGRSVALRGNTFVANTVGVSLNANDTPLDDVFLNVHLERNDFTASLPAGGAGVAICGARLGIDDTTLKLGADNVFPSGAACGALTEAASCTGNADVGFNVANKKLLIECSP